MHTLLISRNVHVAFLYIYLCIKTQKKGSRSLLQVAKTENQQLLHVYTVRKKIKMKKMKYYYTFFGSRSSRWFWINWTVVVKSAWLNS